MITTIPYCEGCIHEGHLGPNCMSCCFGSKYVSKSVYVDGIRMDKVPEFKLNIDMAKIIDDLLVMGGKDMRLPKIKDVIFNKPATIVIWADGSKTMVKCGEGDIYDLEKGLAMAIVKKAYGNKGNYNDIFKKWLPKESNIKPSANPLVAYHSVHVEAALENVSERVIRNRIHNGMYPGAIKSNGKWLIPYKK